MAFNFPKEAWSDTVKGDSVWRTLVGSFAIHWLNDEDSFSSFSSTVVVLSTYADAGSETNSCNRVRVWSSVCSSDICIRLAILCFNAWMQRMTAVVVCVFLRPLENAKSYNNAISEPMWLILITQLLWLACRHDMYKQLCACEALGDGECTC